LPARHAPIYDRIGARYLQGRRPDPRIAGRIWSALGDAQPVLNVGAGSGSYEPEDRPVAAVEPSAVMIAQRAPGAAPAIQAVAERLPFPENAFGAAMGVLTVHHWSDRARGLAELKRVTRGPIALFIRDPDAAPSWWLHHYFPASARLEASRETPIPQLEELLGCRLDVIDVPIPADCTDGFNAAYWRRPAAYLDPAVWQPMSAIALIPEADRNDGMRRLEHDLASGRWHRRFGHLLGLGELDLGYRVLVARPDHAQVISAF
jgi:SAM-dependent methyltransferase